MKKHFSMLMILFGIMSLGSCKDSKEYPKVNKGYLDLTDWDFNSEKSIRLDGDWEFYWEQTPMSEKGEIVLNSLKKADFINLPGTWKSKGLSPKGYATFRSKISLPANRLNRFKLKIPKLNFAGKVIVNNEIIFSIGEFSANENKSISYGKPAYIELPKDVAEIDLGIMISNYSHRNGGGFTQGIILGVGSKIEQKRNLSIIIQASSSFFIIAICLYQLFIFLSSHLLHTFLHTPDIRGFLGFYFIIV